MTLRSATLRSLAAIILALSTLAGAGALVIAEAGIAPAVVATSESREPGLDAFVAPAWAGEERKCASAFGHYDAVCVSTLGLVPCDIDGRLKGVRIGSELFRRTMASFPESRCSVAGLNGQLIFDANGTVRKGN